MERLGVGLSSLEFEFEFEFCLAESSLLVNALVENRRFFFLVTKKAHRSSGGLYRFQLISSGL